MRPYYQKNDITIYCGENSQVMADVMADNSIDLTVTSPPYDLVDEDMVTHYDKGLRDYQGYEWDFVSVAKELWRVTKKGGAVVWVVGDATIDGSETGTSFRQALYFMECGFKLHDTMIYRKPAQFPENGNRYYQEFEFMFVLSRDKPKVTNIIADKRNIYAGSKVHGSNRNSDGTFRQASGVKKGAQYKEYGARYNIWKYATGKGNSGDNLIHKSPASFPEALARDHIISWSNPGDLVFDPFLGSGTTLKMAQELGRRGIGIEISEEYCKIAVERLRQPSFFSIPDKPESKKIKQLGLIK